MGILNKIKKSIRSLTGVDKAEKKAERKAVQAEAAATNLASAGANEDARQKMAAARPANRRRRRSGGRGRDSTIITQGAEIQSRTLLG